MIRIRKLQKKDVEVCYDIQQTSHFAPSEILWSPQTWHFIARTLTDSWVAIDEKDEVVGYVIGLIRYAEEFDNELGYYWMDTCMRRKVNGSSDALMEFLQEQYPFHYAYIHVNNHAVRRWSHNRHGWQTHKTIHGHFKDGSDAHLISYP